MIDHLPGRGAGGDLSRPPRARSARWRH